MARMTKTERIAREGLMKNLIHLNRDGWISSMIEDDIPEAWHTLEADLDVEEKKEKVTLYLDRSVARVFRAMGTGYQARINRLLATWVQMKIAQELKLDAFLDKRMAAAVGDTAQTEAEDTPDPDSAPGDSPSHSPQVAAAMKEFRKEQLENEARAAEEREKNSMSVWERVGLEDERRRQAEADALEEGYRRRALEREAQDRAQDRARERMRDRMQGEGQDGAQDGPRDKPK